VSIDVLIERVRQAAEREAFVWRDTSYSYAWLSDRIIHWRRRLDEAGVESGTVVCLVGEGSPDTVAALLALFARGCIAVPLVPSNHLRWRELCDVVQCQRVARIEDGGPDHELEPCQPRGSHALYDVLRARRVPGLVLFSSGTTGPSKAAVHDVSRLLRKFVKRRHDLRTLAFMPFDHIGGQDTILYAISNGSCLILSDDRSPDGVCRAVERHRVEVLPVVPTFLTLLALSQAYRRYDLSSLKFVTYGAELMSQVVLNKCPEMFPGARLLQKYGATEVGTLRSASRSSDSLWVRIGGEGYQTRVVDGMLQIKAEAAMLGYLSAPSPFTDDGWFVTRDCVEADGEFVRFLGRESDIINVGGRKVFPGHVEDVIRQLPGVADVTVFGQPNPIFGQVVCARVSLAVPQDAKLFTSALKRHCMDRLPDYQVPVMVTIEGPPTNQCAP